MSNQDAEYSDPTAATGQNTIVRVVRRAFTVVFYESDEEVSLLDLVGVYAVAYSLLLTPALIGLFVLTATEGIGTASKTVVEPVSNLAEPRTWLGPVLIVWLGGASTMALVAYVKVLRGVNGRE